MKQFITLLALAFFSSNVFAHPGHNQLVCKSAKNSGSKQALEIFLKRANSVGWATPEIALKVEGKKIELATESEDSSYGMTIHNSPLKVIVVTTEVEDSSFSVMAIPETVKAKKWSLEAEKEECYDSNGNVKFQGVIHGQIHTEGSDIEIDTQILDCEFTYTSGMQC